MRFGIKYVSPKHDIRINVALDLVFVKHTVDGSIIHTVDQHIQIAAVSGAEYPQRALGGSSLRILRCDYKRRKAVCLK